MPLGVDAAVLDASVHGDHTGVDVYCTDCHRGRERYQYPHQPNPADTLAAFAADVSQNCRQCHPSLESHNPGHLGAEPGTPVPTCADCHGGHDVVPAGETYADPIGFCLSCHQDFEHPQVDRAHAELVQNMGAGQDCLMCHNGEPVYPADAQCRTCHTLLTGDRELPSGETISLHVDLQELNDSVHGVYQTEAHDYNPLLCTDCHADVQRYGFPHPELTAEDMRGLRMEMDDICQSCHEEIFQKQLDGVHGRPGRGHRRRGHLRGLPRQPQHPGAGRAARARMSRPAPSVTPPSTPNTSRVSTARRCWVNTTRMCPFAPTATVCMTSKTRPRPSFVSTRPHSAPGVTPTRR
ncbi:MAG: cytochrome c3 family protein [Caldilineaceae bacterium]